MGSSLARASKNPKQIVRVLYLNSETWGRSHATAVSWRQSNCHPQSHPHHCRTPANPKQHTLCHEGSSLCSNIPPPSTSQHCHTWDSGNIAEGQEDFKSQGEHGVCHEVVFPSNVRNYSHKFPPIWLLKCKLNKVDTKDHAKLDTEKFMRPQHYTKDYKWLSKAGRWSGGPPQGWDGGPPKGWEH